LLDKELTCRDVAINVESSMTSVENEELGEHCSRYVVAPVDALQLSVGFVARLVEPSTGEASVGAAGGAFKDWLTCDTHESLQPVKVVTTTVFDPG
jgi:hypothetical protein